MAAPRKKEDDKYSLEAAKPGKAKGLYTDFEEALRRERKAEAKEKKEEKPPLFLRVTRFMHKNFKSFGKGAKFSDEQAQEFAFMGWDVSAEEFYAAYKSLFMVGLACGVVAAGLLYFVLTSVLKVDSLIGMLAAGLCALAPVVGSYLYLGYPKSAVEREKMVSLAYIPEIVNYLTMSMRLTPNLEKAVSFAANHGQGKIAEDLKKLVWDVQIGRYGSIEEGLDDLAYKWGDYNEDFKQALMLIRASILEGNAQRREELLEKASSDVLEGTREKMDLYARKLQQPTVYLYYFGILLPLLLAIILPIGGSMTGAALAKPEYLFVGYNIIIPLMVFAFGAMIVAGKPPTYTPPKIPEDFPGLPPRGQAKVLGVQMPFKIFAVLIIIALAALGNYTDNGGMQDVLNGIIVPLNSALGGVTGGAFDLLGGSDHFVIAGTKGEIPSFDVPGSEGYAQALAKIPHLVFFDQYGFFVGQFTVFGLLIGVSLAISTWLMGEYGERKKVQDEIRAMEGEFKDALYVLASRLGENKPIEDALKNATEFLPKSKISNRIFKRILQNITTMGMTLDAAVFDKTFGAMKDLPSRTIQSGMQFLVGSIDLGVNVAAKSLINLAMQLRNSQKIDESLKRLLQDVTTMLSTMATFVAPIVLAVVSAMQRLIINSLAGASTEDTEATQAAGTQGFQLSGMFGRKEALKDMADPATFITIMGIYVMEVVILLTYFNSQIEETNNELHTYTSIAKALPLAVFLYCVVVYFASSMLGGG